MAAFVALTWKPRKVWNSWEMNTMFTQLPRRNENRIGTNQVLFLSFHRRKKEKKGKAKSSNLDPTRTRLVTSECEKTLFFFCPFQILMCHLLNNIIFFVSLYFSFRKVWQKRYCIAKEGMFTLAHSPVGIFADKQQDFASIFDRFACVINPQTSLL